MAMKALKGVCVLYGVAGLLLTLLFWMVGHPVSLVLLVGAVSSVLLYKALRTDVSQYQ